MIKTKDAIRIARGLLGTPYSEVDCINLIKKVIRTAPGGVPGYTTAGTNALWDSINMSAKYRDLTERHEGLSGIPAGALPFKRYGADDEGHVGIATGEGTVIHSSSAKGKVVETPLTAAEGWDCWGVHRYIETSSVGSADTFPKGEGLVTEESGVIQMEAYKAIVKLSDPDSSLNVRNEPGRGGDVINKLFHGQSVTVLADYDNGWMFVQYGDSGKSGYVSGEYLERVVEEEAPENIIRPSGTPVIVDGEGNEFFPVGGWRVAFRGND